jgi:hypothetical protein
MFTHLRKVLRIPYHRIYLSTRPDYVGGKRITKARLKLLMQSPAWAYGIKEISTKHVENYTIIYWVGKYA